MIDALITGRLHRAAQARASRNGNRFATATVRATAGNGEAVFVNVIAFADAAVSALLALSDGDTVALAGELTPKVWQPKGGGEHRAALDLVAHAVLTEYHVNRRRKAVRQAEPGDTDQSFDDELPAFMESRG